MRIITSYAALFLLASATQAQQWYCQHPSYPPSPITASGMMGFEANGKGYFGLGSDGWNDPNGILYQYDPATNAISNTAYYWGTSYQGVGFSVGGDAFIGLGNMETTIEGGGTFIYVTSYIHRFNLSTWQAIGITDFPGGPRKDAVSFTIANKAYVGGGVDVDSTLGTSVNENDLWEYDPATNNWTPRADMPANIAKGLSFTFNGKGYVIPDGTTTLWQFDPIANSWTPRAPFPGGPRLGMSAVIHNGLCYVGCGSNSQSFHAYNAGTNTWSPAPSIWATSGRSNAVGFTINDQGYVFGGEVPISAPGPTLPNDLWRLGPSTVPPPDSWTQRPWMPVEGREEPIAFSIGTKGYAGGGKSGISTWNTDFWEYDPAAMTWTLRAPLPGIADEGFSINGIGHVTTRAATGNFFAYDPVANTWSPRADLPGGERSRAASFAMEGRGYVGSGLIGGVRQSDLWAYDPATNTWTQQANRPGNPVHSATGFAIGNKGYMCGGNLGGSSAASGSMYRFDPVTNTWTSMGSLPFGNKQNAQGFAIGNKAYLGGGFSGGPNWLKRFDVYDPATNSWTQLADMGGYYRYDGVGFSIGDKGYLFGGNQNFYSDFSPPSSGWYDSSELWEFNPQTITVSPRAFLEGPFNQGTTTMNATLNTAALLPTTDPYGANGYPLPGGTYSDLLVPGVPPTTGNNAIVDRVVVELRDATTPSQVKASRHVWLQRDGDIVDMDGVSPVRFTMAPGSYHVAVLHRNHLGVMTAAPLSLSGTAVVVDFTQAATATYGTNARKTIGTARVLWAGDVNRDGVIKYTGTGNDRDPILSAIGGTTPNNTITGYLGVDTNLDGLVRYTGSGNDRDPILVNVGSTTPNNIRSAQLP